MRVSLGLNGTSKLFPLTDRSNAMKKMIQMMGIATAVLATGFANAESLSMKKVDSRTTTVSFSREETRTLEGAQGLYEKLRSAAEDVCSQVIEPQGLSSQDYRACVTSALDAAVRDANVPLLSLLHGNRGPVLAQLSR
jgi:UrcA family protein